MELICEDFHFYNNGVYKTISKLSPDGWFTDLEKVEPSIRIFGTREQIDESLDTYIELTGLNLNECFEVEPKGSYWYEHRKRRHGENEAITQNKIAEKKLAEYKERYNKLSNNAALITTI